MSGLIGLLSDRQTWQGGEDEREAAIDIGVEIYETWQLGGCMLGQIVAWIFPSVPPYLLECDGSTQSKEDYPLLWEIFDAQGQTAGDNFTLPDLRGHFLVATGASIAGEYPDLGSDTGRAFVTLTTAELPSHNHTVAPHTHTEGIAVPTIINGGLEAPASAAFASTGVTGATGLITDNTGDGTPFPIIPPSTVVRYCMVAR